MKVLLVEDDPGIGRVVVKGLEAAGLEVDWLRVGRNVVDHLKGRRFDIVILDLMLPDVDGILLARQIRLAGDEAVRSLPILMLTARDGLEDKLEGFRCGADDYLTKPFHFEELLMRCLALGRRGKGQPDPDVARIGRLTIDMRAREANVAGVALDLTRREFDLLAFLARNAGQALSRDEILERAWSGSPETTLNAVDVYIGYLRRKLGAASDSPSIVTMRGVGYKLVID